MLLLWRIYCITCFCTMALWWCVQISVSCLTALKHCPACWMLPFQKPCHTHSGCCNMIEKVTREFFKYWTLLFISQTFIDTHITYQHLRWFGVAFLCWSSAVVFECLHVFLGHHVRLRKYSQKCNSIEVYDCIQLQFIGVYCLLCVPLLPCTCDNVVVKTLVS